MRKFLALTLVAVLALGAVYGCAKKESTESSTSTETQPMSPDTAVTDTTAHDSM
jgi:hypothetical protein